MKYGVTYPEGSSNVPPGGFAVLYMQVTPEPSTQCPYVLEVGANSTSLRLLDYKVTYVGSFKCNDKDALRSAKGTITPGDGDTVYDTAEIDLGVLIATSKCFSNNTRNAKNNDHNSNC